MLPRKHHKSSAFTLIELLVVVAIIALLISILLPSLSKARAQARSTLCATRIGQLTKAMIIYADDYNETPPFVGVGHENITDDLEGKTYGHLGPAGSNSAAFFASHESWLFPGIWYTRDNAWMQDRGGWNNLLNNGLRVQDGTLFDYTRFETLYRCPEFERIKDSTKTQDLFNYTRTVLGRKLLSTVMGDAEADDELCPGHIMKISAMYAPASMIMMLDEQWDFHCAGNYEYGGNVLDDDLSGYWMGAETIHGLIGDMLGSYHGTDGKVVNWPELLDSKSGNMGYYDGHVALQRDPWAWRSGDIDDGLAFIMNRIGGEPEKVTKLLGLLLESAYAQRGINVTLDLLMQMI